MAKQIGRVIFEREISVALNLIYYLEHADEIKIRMSAGNRLAEDVLIRAETAAKNSDQESVRDWAAAIDAYRLALLN